MKIPLVYNVRSLARRPVSSAMTALGVALVVGVFIAMLALANGFKMALVRTGSPGNVLVLRKGADSELSSGISRDNAAIIGALPEIATGGDGQPLVSPEVFVPMNLESAAGGGEAQLVVTRGVTTRAFEVRQGVRIVHGRMFAPGRDEVIIGVAIAPRLAHSDVGDTIHFAGRGWLVAGHFAAGGSSFESEIWGENEQLMPVLRGQVFQVVSFRLKSAGAFDAAKRTLEDDPRLQVDAHRESEFYASQSLVLRTILNFLAVFITGIMAVGAVFGAVNTMYAAVASRTGEIAVLLTLGFRPRSVLASFLAEAAFLALVGGALGCLVALPINGIVTSTTNWSSFSMIAFSFLVTPRILIEGIVFSVVMGLVGGFFPARRASRMPVVQAIR
ncbi:MAG TPA: FtsX-like permease family protein [Gemmatimonadales bacterium]|nr:FtsX-like permease family protein [Gemmatimonadales bacterium]